MAPYNTPGVYVEEIPKLPPSVAPVATAIPAFVGYTQQARAIVDDDLVLKPKRIESLVEFEQYFGGPQPETDITVTIDETTVATPGRPAGIRATAQIDGTARSNHILHYAMQLFYANGGKSAYVVSVGTYLTLGDDLDRATLEAGIDELVKFDEPTLIVVPEAQ
ncbi:MAG TPA: hypothetical protein VF228_14820, partial [Iamia sp.]